jgi:hypothetical protein
MPNDDWLRCWFAGIAWDEAEENASIAPQRRVASVRAAPHGN